MSSPLTTVKTAYSYTAKFIGSTLDPCFTKGKLNSSPAVYITGNSYFLDYSECQNSVDLKFLNQFFSGLTGGDTFGFSGGYYYNDTTNTKTEWAGVLQLSGKTGTYNQYVSCTSVSSTAGLCSGYYLSKNFLNPFQITAIKGTTANILISYTPKNTPYNLEYLGIYGSKYGYEEYIELAESTSNIGRFKTSNFIKLNDNSEVIYLNSSLTNEDRFFKKSTINLLQRGIPPLSILASTQLSNGVTKVTNSSGTNLILMDNQNQYQNVLRQEQDPTNTYSYYSNNTLKTVNSNTEEISNLGNLSLNYSRAFNIKVISNYVTTYNADALNITPFTGTNQYYDTIYIDNVIGNAITLVSGFGTNPIKLDFSDAVNKGCIIECFLDYNCTQQLDGDFYMLGTPGYEGASFIYLSNRTTASRTFYLKITKNVSNIIQVMFS